MPSCTCSTCHYVLLVASSLLTVTCSFKTDSLSAFHPHVLKNWIYNWNGRLVSHDECNQGSCQHVDRLLGRFAFQNGREPHPKLMKELHVAWSSVFPESEMHFTSGDAGQPPTLVLK
jgi:hypothetical protein